MSEDRKIGRFTIDLHIVHKHPELALKVLKNVLVLRAECMDYAHCIEYVGVHDDFALLTRYGTVPEYTCDLTQIKHAGAALGYERGPWRLKHAS